MSLTIRNTYGRPHPTSETNPTHVTGASGYRVSMTATLPVSDARFADCVTWLTDGEHKLHTRPGGYGLIFLESEEHAVTYFGPIEQVTEFQREQATNPGATFDAEQGIMVAQWPHGKGWDQFLPPAYWNMEQVGAIADGVGLVTAFEHPVIRDAEVIVYEFEGQWLAEKPPAKMVTYHCTACHQDTFRDSGKVHENKGPADRRWVARRARQHIVSAARHGVNRGGESQCRPADPAMLKIVNAVARDNLHLSYNPLPDDDASYCATKGPCSIIRELRAGVRPPVFRG